MDGFLTKYHEPAFLTGYWWNRMKEVLSDQTPTEEEIRKFREIGVVLNTD